MSSGKLLSLRITPTHTPGHETCTSLTTEFLCFLASKYTRQDICSGVVTKHSIVSKCH